MQGFGKKTEDGNYVFISKIAHQRPFMFLVNNETISKGDYLIILECSNNQEQQNKVVLACYSLITPQMKETTLPQEAIKQLMVATSFKIEKVQLPEEKGIYYVYNCADSGVSFSSYLLCNQTTDKSITQTVKFSDNTITCLPPYDRKAGEFDVTVPPNHQEIVLFRAKIRGEVLPLNIFPVSKINIAKLDCNISPTQSFIQKQNTTVNGKKQEPNNFSEMCENVKNIMTEVIQSYKTKACCLNYNFNEASTLTHEIAEKLISIVSKVYESYKFAATCILLNKKEGGLHMSSSCYWDEKTDGNITINDSNEALYFILTVFAIY
jgi:dynein light chain Tctex-type 1